MVVAMVNAGALHLSRGTKRNLISDQLTAEFADFSMKD